MKKLIIAAVLLACLALIICAIIDVLEASAVWLPVVTFASSLLFHCFPIVIYRYIIKRKPVENAKQLCLWWGVMVVLYVLRKQPGESFMDTGELIVSALGITAGAAINYLMLSE